MVIAAEMVGSQVIIGGLEMTSALSRAEVFCVRRGYRLLHNDGLTNTCIAFFKSQVKTPS